MLEKEVDGDEVAFGWTHDMCPREAVVPMLLLFLLGMLMALAEASEVLDGWLTWILTLPDRADGAAVPLLLLLQLLPLSLLLLLG